MSDNPRAYHKGENSHPLPTPNTTHLTRPPPSYPPSPYRGRLKRHPDRSRVLVGRGSMQQLYNVAYLLPRTTRSGGGDGG